MDLLPPEEQWTAWRLSTFGLRGLLVYCRGFQVALSLFDFSDARIEAMKGLDQVELSLPLREWQFLAGRDGAITIFHFGKAMGQIRKVIFESCPVLASRLDRKAFKSVVGSFDKAFPKWEAIRHAVAHHAELRIDPLITEEHYVRGPLSVPGLPPVGAGVRQSFSNTLVGRRFIHTFDKYLCEYELSQDTLNSLHDIRIRYYQIFSPVAMALREISTRGV
jgi:hypothetical protein